MSNFYLVCLWLVCTSLSVGQTRTKETFTDVAERLVKAINAADCEAVGKLLSKEMLEAFPAEKCKAFCRDIARAQGKIGKLEAPKFQSVVTAVLVAHCERGALKMTLTLDQQGRVAGMLFEPIADPTVAAKNQTKLRLPFDGAWEVAWGGDTEELNHHHRDPTQVFAFDLLGVGPDGKTQRKDARRNEDYFAFGRELLAPADGLVTEVIDGVRDNTPGSMNALSAVGNAVFIQHSDHEVSVLAHLKQGSTRVRAGDNVKKGQVIGLCGNSGNSSQPHLHYHLQNAPVIQNATGIKCYFEDVGVEKDGAKKAHQSYSPVKGDIISPLKKK